MHYKNFRARSARPSPSLTIHVEPPPPPPPRQNPASAPDTHTVVVRKRVRIRGIYVSNARYSSCITFCIYMQVRLPFISVQHLKFYIGIESLDVDCHYSGMDFYFCSQLNGDTHRDTLCDNAYVMSLALGMRLAGPLVSFLCLT